MPKLPTFDPTVEDCLELSITQFKKWGHLKDYKDVINNSFAWWRGENKIGGINYSIRSFENNLNWKILTLSYENLEESIKCQIELEAIPTNLGNGKRWYFRCPHTQKRCMKLVMPQGEKYFLHRTAYNLLYKQQTESKKYRSLDKRINNIVKATELQKLLDKPYSKTHYRGYPTRRQIKLFDYLIRIEAKRNV